MLRVILQYGKIKVETTDMHPMVALPPFLNSTGGPNGKQQIEQRANEYLNVSGSFFCQRSFSCVEISPANTTWSGYGGAFGHNPASGHTQRDSNYITHYGQTYFHSNQLPAGVSARTALR